jgi:hypothetical protein
MALRGGLLQAGLEGEACTLGETVLLRLGERIEADFCELAVITLSLNVPFGARGVLRGLRPVIIALFVRRVLRTGDCATLTLVALYASSITPLGLRFGAADKSTLIIA